jgi:hypothetical protein
LVQSGRRPSGISWRVIRKSGAFTTFTASHDLYQRVKTMVEQWRKGSLRETPSTPQVDQPGEAGICELGQAGQVQEWNASHAQILAAGAPEVASFVIHGKSG